MAQSSLIAIDPGENTGLAVFLDGMLALADCADVNRYQRSLVADAFVIEIPFYSGQTAGKDPQALIKLALNAGRWIDRFRSDGPDAPIVRQVYPSQWKGSITKSIHNARVLAKLSPAELTRVPCLPGIRSTAGNLPASKLHNVIDAIGLGLFALGRMGRGA